MKPTYINRANGGETLRELRGDENFYGTGGCEVMSTLTGMIKTTGRVVIHGDLRGCVQNTNGGEVYGDLYGIFKTTGEVRVYGDLHGVIDNTCGGEVHGDVYGIFDTTMDVRVYGRIMPGAMVTGSYAKEFRRVQRMVKETYYAPATREVLKDVWEPVVRENDND